MEELRCTLQSSPSDSPQYLYSVEYTFKNGLEIVYFMTVCMSELTRVYAKSCGAVLLSVGR